MIVAMNQWIAQAHIDYIAGRQHAMDLKRRPVSTAVISRPGESKSEQIEKVLPKNLEDRLLADKPSNANMDEETGGMVDIPASLVGTHIHWSPRGLVAVISEPINMRDAPDLKGFLVPRKDGTSSYTMPDLVALERSLYEAGAKIVILFFDEFLGTDHLTMKAMTDVFLNGRFGSYSLRPTTWVIGASNRPEDGAGVNRALTILTNRINVLHVNLPIDAYIKYARQNLGLPELVLAFAKQYPGKITVDVPPREGAFPSFRSLTFAGQWLAAYKKSIGDNDPMTLPLGDGHEYAQAKVAGFIGEGLMTEFVAYSRVVNELASISEILADPENAKLPATNRMDACYAAAQSVVYYAKPENVDALWTYTMRLPKELQVATAKDLLAKGGGVLQNSKALGAWITRNSSLIRASLG